VSHRVAPRAFVPAVLAISLLAGCAAAPGASQPAAVVAPTQAVIPVTPVPVTAAPTAAPTALPAADQLAAACASLAAFRAMAPYVEEVSSQVGGDDSAWEAAADALSYEMGLYDSISEPLSGPNAPLYKQWYISTIFILRAVSEAVAHWDSGRVDDDPAATRAGDDSMLEARGYIAAFNDYAAEFEGGCP